VRASVPHVKLIVCPSYYSDDPTLDRVFGPREADYLATLGEKLAGDIEIFWTGPEVCSREISVTHLERIGKLLQRKPTLWDNYPVNDGPRMSTQLHLRGFTGRSHRIAPLIQSHFINPALQPFLTQIPAQTLAAVYADADRYDYADAFQSACARLLGQPLAGWVIEDLLRFQDVGLHRLGDQMAVLHARYSGIDHPAAREIVRWLDGEFQVGAEMVQTQ
jgi:hyaluronoglucosaminidase